MSRARMPWTARIFAACLLAYPRAFRRRFGAPMRDTFLRQDAAAARAGTGARIRFLVRTALHTIASGLAERIAAVVRLVWWPSHRPHLYAPEGRHAMFWDTLRADVRHALRLAVKTPLFTLLTVVALALGIGANSAIFAVINGVLLQPLPYQEPDRLVMVWSQNLREGRDRTSISAGNFTDYRDLSQSFSGMAYSLSFLVRLAVKGQESSDVVWALRVGHDLFRVLGRSAAIGRTFVPNDPDGTAVLSHGFWQQRFGGDRSVIGRSLTLSGDEQVTIVGVMPPDFVFPYRTMFGPSGVAPTQSADMWIVMPFQGWRWVSANGALVRTVHALAGVGRLKPGGTIDQARADLSAVAAQLAQTYPNSNTGWSATAISLHDQTVGDVRPALLVLLAGVGIVLLMASVNVANLVLARSMSRQQELSVRVALGADRRRIVQQAFTESLLLACLGGLASLLVVRWGVQALVALAPSSLPRLADVQVDVRVVLFTLGVALLIGTIVGIAPALAATRYDLRGALQESSRGASGSSPARRRLRAALVVAEIALAVVLTVGAGLLLRSFARLLAVDPGFTPERLLTLQMNVPDHLTTPQARRAFLEELFSRLERLPGVTAVGGTTRLPLGSTNVSTTIAVEGRNVPTAELPEVEFRRSLHDYFEAMGIPVLRGRGFTRDDTATSPPVAVINQTMARRIFGDRDPIGTRVRMGTDPAASWITIVGIIGDVRHAGLEAAPAPEMYVDYRQNPPNSPFIVLRTIGAPLALAELVRAEARALSPSMPIFDVRTMEHIRADSVAERRFTLLLVGLFGTLALGLAASGVYGVMALVVSERTGEMGVRMALGARAPQVVGLVLGQAARLALLGVLIGVAAAMLLTPLLASQLYGVNPLDPWTFAGVPLVLLALAAIAALVPALRAMRLDPVTALRHT